MEISDIVKGEMQTIPAEGGWRLVKPILSEDKRRIEGLSETPIVAWVIRPKLDGYGLTLPDMRPVTVPPKPIARRESYCYRDPKGAYRWPGMDWTTDSPIKAHEQFEKMFGIFA
jgi:hypothetical protein